MGIDGKWLHAEKVDWFLDRVQDPKTKQLIIQNKDIPGSMSDFVTIDPNTHEHIDQVPLHFLIHANLNPRIKGAGIKGNCILKLQKVRNMADQEAELEKLREQVAQMKRDNEELQTQITDAQEAKAKQDEADKADLFAKLLATGKFTEEELKSWTLPQAKAAFFAINKTATPQGSPKPNPAMQLAGNAGAGEKPASVWDLYKEKQRNNALAPYTNWSGK
jgi:cell division protein FtsB